MFPASLPPGLTDTGEAVGAAADAGSRALRESAALFEPRVADALRSLDELALADEGELAYEFQAGHRWRNEQGAGGEPALLTIIAPRTIFAVEPEQLRAAVSEVAADCQRDADEQHERDEELAAEWLQRVRRLSGAQRRAATGQLSYPRRSRSLAKAIMRFIGPSVTITSLAEESRPPASTGGDRH